MDLTNMGEIKMVIKNDQLLTEFPLYTDTGEVNLAIGQLVFKVSKNKFNDIKRIYESGLTVFYITSTSQGITTVIYTGLYKVYDSLTNVNSLNIDAAATQAALSGQPNIIKDNSIASSATAIVTRKLVSSTEANRPKTQRPTVGGSKNTGTTNLG